MKEAEFNRAKKIESEINEIAHTLRCLDSVNSTYTVGMFCGANNQNALLNKHIGFDFLNDIKKQTVDALTLKKLKLEQEFRVLIEL